jgi:hypothetical protein
MYRKLWINFLGLKKNVHLVTQSFNCKLPQAICMHWTCIHKPFNEWKRLIRNWFFCESIWKSAFVFRDKKNQFFLTQLASSSSSGRTYCLILLHYLFWLLLIFLHQNFRCYFFISIRTTYSYRFPFWFRIMFTAVAQCTPFLFFSLLVFKKKSGRRPNTPKRKWIA